MVKDIKIEKRIIKDYKNNIFPIWDYMIKNEVGVWISKSTWFKEEDVPAKYRKYINRKIKKTFFTKILAKVFNVWYNKYIK